MQITQLRDECTHSPQPRVYGKWCVFAERFVPHYAVTCVDRTHSAGAKPTLMMSITHIKSWLVCNVYNKIPFILIPTVSPWLVMFL